MRPEYIGLIMLGLFVTAFAISELISQYIHQASLREANKQMQTKYGDDWRNTKTYTMEIGNSIYSGLTSDQMIQELHSHGYSPEWIKMCMQALEEESIRNS